MVKCSTTVNSSKFERSMKRFLSGSKRAKRTVLTQQARLGVRDIIRITPPNRGGYNSKAGESAVKSDLARILKPMSPEGIEQFQDFFGGSETSSLFGHKGAKPLGPIKSVVLTTISSIKEFHTRRRRRNGRVMNVSGNVTTGLRKRDLIGLDVGIVSRDNFARYLKLVVDKIGILASGWNAGARQLNLSLPTWISRHGDKYGRCTVTAKSNSIVISVVNSVRYVGNVVGLRNRLQSALNNRAKQMDRQMDDFAIKKEARAAGLKIR